MSTSRVTFRISVLAVLLGLISAISGHSSRLPGPPSDDALGNSNPDESPSLYVLSRPRQVADEFNRGFRTVFEPSLSSLISPTKEDFMGGSPDRVVPVQDGETPNDRIRERMHVNRGCIQDVTFNKRPFDFKIKYFKLPPVPALNLGGLQKDNEITYRDRNGCLQIITFAQPSYRQVADWKGDTQADAEIEGPKRDTDVLIDLARHTTNNIRLSPANYALLKKQSEEED